MEQFQLTPELEKDVALCEKTVKSMAGGVEPDAATTDATKKAAGRLLRATQGPVDKDGSPTSLLDKQIHRVVQANDDKIRDAIRKGVAAGKTAPTDYYELLYKVLEDSGAMTSSTMPVSPDLARTLHTSLGATDLAADNCAWCAACATCSTCSVCSACGSCVLSVVVGVGAAAITASVVTVGGIAGSLFSSATPDQPMPIGYRS